MSYLPVQNTADDERLLPLETTRDEVITKLNRKNFEVLVVGGGIIGASVARLAAFNGLRTALLEKADYASGTSSRSSKMLHGGLRYLAMGDIRQVYEGLSSRDQLLTAAPHLARLIKFQIPIQRGDLKSRIVMGSGLKLYDLLAKLGGSRVSRSRWIEGNLGISPELNAEANQLSGCYEFSDGLMDDARIVIESILSARQEGAVCLNYSKVMTIDAKRAGEVGVGWTDLVSGKHYETTTGIVINCAGPWAPMVGRVIPGNHLGEIRFSRGSHILFNRPWPGPALLFPQSNSTNYFVWPHAYGTMVGTTEREVVTLQDDPLPAPDEIDEILERLKRDLPNSGLSRDSAHYCFAGIRTLPAEARVGRTAKLSRRHRWVHHDGVLSLVGGKFTSAAWTAYEGLKHVYKLAGILTPLVPIADRKFPGAGNLDGATSEFTLECSNAKVPEILLTHTLRRLGSRVRHLHKCENWSAAIGDKILRGEIELALRTEQVVYLEDLMRRRLGLEFSSDNGRGVVAEIAELSGARLHSQSADDVKYYCERIESIRALTA